jgi:hypothetical protein
MTSTVRIDWSRDFDNEYAWNEACAWAIEHFGLPGDRFETHASVNYMEFIFKSNKDALLMAIRWNARIVPDDELTVEAVSKFMY